MSQYFNLASAKSSNAKLGKGVATNYRPVGDSSQGLGTCPPTCKMLNNGCYAQTSFTGMHQRNAQNRFDSVEKLLEKGSKFIRLHTSGDFFMPDGEGGYVLDLAYWTAVVNLANNHPDVTIWTYCHDVSKLIDFDISYVKGNILPIFISLLLSIIWNFENMRNFMDFEQPASFLRRVIR